MNLNIMYMQVFICSLSMKPKSSFWSGGLYTVIDLHHLELDVHHLVDLHLLEMQVLISTFGHESVDFHLLDVCY